MANQVKQVFSSTTTTVISLAASLANAANTYTGLTGLTNTQLDNSTELYTDAIAVLTVPETFVAAPTAGAAFNLYCVLDDIDGTTDETPEPGAADIVNLAAYVGSFVVDNQDVNHIKPIMISLLGVRKARFFLENQTGQATTYSATPLTVKITPFTVGPT